MKIEDNYLVFSNVEAKQIVRTYMHGDQYCLVNVQTNEILMGWAPVGRSVRTYDPVDTWIGRRPVSLCTPELLAHVEPVSVEKEHFII